VGKKGDLVVVHGPYKALASNLVLGAAFLQQLSAVVADGKRYKNRQNSAA
jgi:hypothetical protein